MSQDIEDQNAKKNSQKSHKLFAQYNTLLRPPKFQKVLSEQLFVLIKRPKSGIFYPSLKKFKMDPQRSKIRARHTNNKFQVDLGSKRYLGQRDPFIESMGYVGGGS